MAIQEWSTPDTDSDGEPRKKQTEIKGWDRVSGSKGNQSAVFSWQLANCRTGHSEDVEELLNRRDSPLWLPELVVVSIAIPTALMS